ncbi:MAG: ChbG/HpnK family deacetylase [Elusimicrobia bacterium]|nr:ChbG/HpnK family deacetylase [Elusimicrobiota bacterium]
MKKIIVNADDFGYRESINKGIVLAHKNGVVSSASLFVDREGTDEAVGLAKENPSLGMGIHLDLDRFFTVDHAMGVVTELINADLEAVKGEIRRQIEKYLAFGFSADHVNSHHHAHLNAQLFPLVCAMAQEYKIPAIRFLCNHFVNDAECDRMRAIAQKHLLSFADHFIEGWYWGNVDEPFVVAELMTHPGYGELWREAELAHCCQPPLKQYFIDNKIDLLRFSDIYPQK